MAGRGGQGIRARREDKERVKESEVRGGEREEAGGTSIDDSDGFGSISSEFLLDPVFPDLGMGLLRLRWARGLAGSDSPNWLIGDLQVLISN